MMHGLVMPQTPPPPIPVDYNWLLRNIPDYVFGLAVLATVLVGMRWFFRSPIAEAMGEAIRSWRRRRFGAEPEDTDDPRISATEQQIRALEAHVSELSERLDFAERLLAERRQPQLPRG